MNPLVSSILFSDETTGSGASFTIDQSLRYSSSMLHLDRTPSSSGDRDMDFFYLERDPRVRFYYKGNGVVLRHLLMSGISDDWCFTSTDRLLLQGSSTAFRQTNMRFRDLSAWYHIVVVCDIQNGTANDTTSLVNQWRSSRKFNPSAGDVFGINQSDNQLIIGTD